MSEESQTSAATGPDPVRKISKYVLYITIFLFVWYVAADRLAPWTEQARIQTYVIPIVSQVSGRVVEVNVEKDAVVQPGDILFKIDPADYGGARVPLLYYSDAVNHVDIRHENIFRQANSEILWFSPGSPINSG
jgi:hypothetical protein